MKKLFCLIITAILLLYCGCSKAEPVEESTASPDLLAYGIYSTTSEENYDTTAPTIQVRSSHKFAINYSRDREAAVKSDFVSLHCPLTTENAGFVNESFISEMKDGAILINTARGGLVDEPALAAALKSGKLAAAAVDVVSAEPIAADNPLLGLENCIITPHLAWAPKEMRRIITETLAANLQSWLDGGTLNRVDLL